MPASSTPEVGAWWGPGAPPTERWPGVTIAIDDCDGRYRFDATLADRVCEWFPRFCTHSKGVHAGQRFDLLDYQVALILRPLIGWVWADSWLRRFRKAYIEIPKKNGKTALIAGLGLYMLLVDNEPGAEVYVAAADRDQARILFSAAKAMVEANPALMKRLQVYQNYIERKDDKTAFFKVLSAEAATKHGPNIHCLIIDELHAQPDRELFETLTRGTIARRQPLTLLITTAGDDDESICFEERDYGLRVLHGTVHDEQFLPVIFEASPEDDWQSPETWAKVNPGLGTTITEGALAGFAREAAHEPRKRNDFLRYHLNRWVNQATSWIPIDWWDACSDPLPADEVLRTLPCAVGIDMAQKIDLASAVVVFRLPLEDAAPDAPVEIVAEDDEGAVIKRTLSLNYRIAIVPAFWLPEDTLRERSRVDGVPYDLWRNDGLLHATEGAIVDEEAIAVHVSETLPARFPLIREAEVGYDPAFATGVHVRLSGAGCRTVEVLQNYKYMSEACQVFEALVKAKRVLHGGHKVLRWNVENVAVKRDDAGRIRPVKPKKQAKRIDGVVATLMALYRLMAAPLPAPPPAKPRISVIQW